MADKTSYRRDLRKVKNIKPSSNSYSNYISDFSKYESKYFFYPSVNEKQRNPSEGKSIV